MLNTFMLTGGNFIIDALKHLTFALDKAIYSLVQFAYSVFYYLANATILNETIVTNFTYRMYTLLGIIMVFVLAFNLLSYIVDPDKITDKKTGASSFVKDVMLAIVIISVSPMLFTKLYSLQSKILTSGVIENLVLGGATSEGATNAENWATGENSDKSLTQYYVDNGGNTMVASVYVAFLYPAGGKFTALDCDSDASKNGQYANYCDAYRKVKEGYGLGAFGDFIANDDYEYTPFLTTVAGIVLLFFMLSFCINLAKRVGKMALIQLIAPVPVTLELLPNKKGLRDNWLKTLGKVYIEVFFYLLVMFFIILLISLIPGTIGKIFSDIVTDGIGPVKLLATVILIYGLLQFGKEAPQMLFDLLGIKTTGIIKEAAKRALALPGVMAGAAATFGGGTIGNFARNMAATDGNIGQKLLSGVGGAGSALARNLWGLRNVHNAKDLAKLRKDTNKKVITARVNRDAYAHAHGGTIGGVLGGHIHDAARAANLGIRAFFGAENDYQKKRGTERVLQDYKKLYNDSIASLWKNDSQWSAANSEYNKYKNMIESGAVKADDKDNVTGKEYGELRDQYKKMADGRKNQVLLDKKLQFMEGAGKLNNFIDANQGVKGITKDRINIDDIGKIENVSQANEQMNIVDQMVKDWNTLVDGAPGVSGEGFKPNLDNLEKATPYQTEKIQDKLREDAKKATQQAAEQAANKNDNKK